MAPCVRTVRVLVIDDHQDVAEMTALLIGAACAAVETRCAFDGGAGVELACAWWPHLVVTDIDMPLLTGIEAALTMRTLLAERPPTIIAVTGNTAWETDPMALAVFDSILIKPIDPAGFVARVAATCHLLDGSPGRGGEG